MNKYIKYKKININIRNILTCLSVLGLFCPFYMTSLYVVLVPRLARYFILAVSSFVFLLLQITKQFKPVKLIPSILLVIMCIIIFWGYYVIRDDEVEAIIRFIIIFVLMIFASNDKRWYKYFLFFAVLFGAIYIFSTIWLYYDTNSYFKYFADNLYPSESRFAYWRQEGYTAGITDHYSTNGMALATTTIVYFSLMFNTNKTKSKVICLIFSVLSFYALILTGKRAHLLFSVIAIVIPLILIKRRESNHSLKFFIALIVVLIAAALAYALIPQVANLLDRFTNMSEDVNILGRYQFWEAALQSFQKNKIFGIGWFGFRNIVAPTVNYTGHAHNVYIQLLCETGVIGFVTFMVWFIYSLVSAIRLVDQVSKYNSTSYLKFIAFFSLAYQIYFLLYCFTGNPLYDVYVYPGYFASCIMAIYLVKSKYKIKN